MMPEPQAIQGAIDDWYRMNGGCASVATAVRRIGEEYAELASATDPQHIREEMSDVASCLFQAASIAGFDLIEAVRDKLEINRHRSWDVRPDGCLKHVKGSDPRDALAQGTRAASRRRQTMSSAETQPGARASFSFGRLRSWFRAGSSGKRNTEHGED